MLWSRIWLDVCTLKEVELQSFKLALLVAEIRFKVVRMALYKYFAVRMDFYMLSLGFLCQLRLVQSVYLALADLLLNFCLFSFDFVFFVL